LYGVDNSADMLQKCPNYAELILSNNFPVEHAPFDLIFCNWTLHFVQHKISYLRDCFNSLNDNGYMVLSEKTSLDNLPIHFYHEFKRSQGVSQTEITQKEQSLVGVMHINSPEWYIQTLRSLGFKKVWIIDAYWCFTTFLVEK
jgi:tRNA (cmo5U34)-methyltransferase